ncbi:MAG: helix-turn-helix transcriptional regulator [Candidatus Dormibacteria bacterium]
MAARQGSKGAAAGGGAGRLYNRIAVLRAERELSRYQLADAVGVNYQTIGYLERGEYNPSLDLALRLAELFELPVEAIFSREPLRPMSEELYTPEREHGSGVR